MDLTTRAKMQLGELLFGHLQLQQQLEDSEKARGEAMARAQAALEKLATLDHPKETNSANDAERPSETAAPAAKDAAARTSGARIHRA